MHIRGVYPPIATPFDDQGYLHVAALTANIRKWEDTGLDGYVVAGSNGESVLLEPEEIMQAVRTVRQAASSGKLVIVGTGCQSTSATIRLTQAAADAGADAALVMPPYFYTSQMTETALLHHYEAVADASRIPILIYNVPQYAHLNIAPETVARLAQHERIVGLKDSAGNIGQIVDFIRLCPPDFDVLIGNAPAFLAGLQAGAVGGILALANVAPRECVSIWRLVAQERFNEAREIHSWLMAIGRAVTTGYGVPGLKAAMDQLGYYGGAPRPPLLPVTEAVREALRKILVEAGLLV